MPVYIDEAIWDWHGLKWAHLLADDIDELHRFAARLGVHRTSYQGPPKTSIPHYDLTGYERRRAIASGAIACSRYEIVAVLRRVRSRPAMAGRGAADPAVAARRHDPLRASDVSSTASAQNSLQA